MISIIVPVYNVQRYLHKCVESLINQILQDIKIILIIDGSPDHCSEMADEYLLEDHRVFVVHQINSGVSSARNAGLKLASGDYIGFCDPDDWADPHMYEDLLLAIEQHNADLSICGYNYYDEDYRVDDKRLYPIRETEKIDQKILMDRMSDIPPSIRHGVWNKLFRKNLLQEMMFDLHLRSSEDLKFIDDYIIRIKDAVIVHKPLYLNLVRSNSATHGGLSVRSLADSFRVHEEMYLMASNSYPDLKDRALAFLMDVFVLKYNMAKYSCQSLSKEKFNEQTSDFKRMRGYIRRYALKALFDKEICWKTRIMYLILK